jgi:hypothetical protein
MNANQIKNHLAQVFEQDYQGYGYFVEHVINLIFTGDDAYEALPVPEDYLTDENRQKANESGILQIQKVGTIDAEEPIDLFDITLSDKKELQYNRVGIQQFIRSSLFPFTNAFMLFHNKSTEGKDWRFSFAYKETTIKGMTPAKRYTYLFGKSHRARTASERFAKLAEETKDTRNLLNAFSVEALSKAFFDEYKEQYKAFCAFLYEHKNDTEYFGQEFLQWEDKYLRDYVKKMMGRITFIYFLQRKGWMNGDMEYMQKAFANSACQEDYLDAFLEPLFFGVLNTKPEERKSLFAKEGWDLSLLDEWKDIPYLNGGLFERDDQDKPKSKFPAERFKDLFDFYARYNFTIDENDPDDAEVGVDPEMLGHIFENLLEDNKDKGAFYTPKEIVRYMSEESIAQYLKAHAEEALHPAIDALIKEKKVDEVLQNKTVASNIYALLQEVKVCDPAIGSGAFPMGVLNVLYHARLMLYGFIKPQHEFSPADVKREIIQNNIYGVDIEKGAIDIARLRFWLSIVVDSNQPEALPNFDYKFMQGNSLLEEFGGIDLSSLQDQIMQTTMYEPQRDLFGNVEDSQIKMTFTQKETVDNLQANLEKYFSIDDHTLKQAVKEEISNSVKNHVSYNIELRRDQCLCLIQEANEAISDEESQIEDIKARFPEDRMPMNEIRKHEKKIFKLKKEIERNNQKILQYDSVSCELETIDLTSNDSFFLWHTWFKDVFDNGGFDVVIGNPPYGVSIQGDYRKEVVRCLGNVPDYEIYYYFIQIAAILLIEKGILSFIIPNTYLFNNYAKNYRIGILERWNVIEILDCTKFKIFESATVFNTINTWRKTINGTHRCIGYRKTAGIDSFKSLIDSPQLHMEKEDLLKMNQNWGLAFFLSSEVVSIINKISEQQHTISDFYNCSQGYIPYRLSDLVSTYGKVEGTRIKEERLWHSREKTKDYYIQEIYGRDITKYDYKATGEYIKYGKHVACYVDPVYFTSARLLVREITNPTIIACFVSEPFINDPQLLPIISKNDSVEELLLLWGILNSRLATFYHFNHSPKATKGAFPKILVQDIKDFPLPDIPDEQRKSIINHVDRILSTKKENPEADTSAWEEEIDFIVYKLYGLNYDEVLVVDPETPISKEEYDKKKS